MPSKISFDRFSAPSLLKKRTGRVILKQMLKRGGPPVNIDIVYLVVSAISPQNGYF